MSKEIPQLEQEQMKKLADLGDRLRQLREERLLTLQQVAAKTMIQPRLLHAIEAGKLHELPEPVYIQGFIKHYADALGLDGAVFSKAFPTEPDIRSIQPSWKDSPAAQLRPIHLYVAYVLLIAVAIGGLSYLMRRSASWVTGGIKPELVTVTQATVGEEATTTAGTSQPPATANPIAVDNPNPSEISGKAVRVDITLTGQSWLRIQADGKTEFQGILPEGTQKTWMAESQLIVRAGNAGAVLLSYNKGEAELMGALGAVEEKTFSTDQKAASIARPDSDLIPR